MTHKEYSEQVVALAQVLLKPLMPVTFKQPFDVWWAKLCTKCGVMPQSEMGESLTWSELLLIHGYLVEQANSQFADRLAEMPERDGKEILASSLPSSDLKEKAPV